jgi:hypothetical protein
VAVGRAPAQGNPETVEIAFFDKTGVAGHLDAAQAHLDAARAVFAEAGAGAYLAEAAHQQAGIDQRRSARQTLTPPYTAAMRAAIGMVRPKTSRSLRHA